MTLHKIWVCIVSYGDDSLGQFCRHSVGKSAEKRAYQ
jgi:hypothetical protein